MTLSFTGMLSIFIGLTLIVLLFVIWQKEPDTLADKIDKGLLGIAFLCLAITTVYSGALVMAGALVGSLTAKFTFALVVNNSLKVLFLLAAWTKIIRSQIHTRKGR